MKKIILFQLFITSFVLFLLAYGVYTDYLWWLEGNSFFTTIPDFARLQFSLPGELPQYVASFLAQFYKWPVCGALIQVSFAWVVLLAGYLICYRLFQNKGMLWLAFIPVAVFVSGQYDDITLTRSVLWSGISVVLAILVGLVTLKWKTRPRFSERFWCSPFFSYLVPCLLLGGSVYSLLNQPELEARDSVIRLERLSLRKSWDAVLQEVTPEVAVQSPVKLRFALLALSEKELLPEVLFRYQVTAPGNFLFERQQEQMCCHFNALFYDCLGFPNEAIHQSFEAGMRGTNGATFRSMRSLTDVFMRERNLVMAAKYLEMMKHTTCHRQWVESRSEYLAQLKKENKTTSKNEGKDETTATPFFIGAHPFLSDMARVVDRYPNNQKAVDYLLCGLLVAKDLGKFMQIFRYCFSGADRQGVASWPRYYEEALLMCAQQQPGLLQKYSVRQERMQRFQEFSVLLQQGKRQELELRFGDTFWYHYYFRS